jgi:shikimate kinase
MKDRRIIIVGFMGCGKTTVAQALARELDCGMIDLDSFIAEHEGRSPAGIIQQDGEAVFRMIETEALRDAFANHDARVIALGGGAWTIEANRMIVAEHDCLSVWLDAPFELCWERITSSDATRPMAPDLESAERLYASRCPTYELAMLRLDATGKSLTDIVAEIRSGL